MAISQIIQYEGNNTTFVWKHPIEDFNTTTQLIVHESQEVLFLMNGQALDLFGPGRHTLETQNIPFLKKFLNLPTGGVTPFHCEIYYINKTEQMSIKWGTDSRVSYMEPTYKFPLQIGASGEMSLKVEDARKLLIKLVGTEAILSQERLVSMFRMFLMTRIKSYLAQTLREKQLNVFELDEHLNDLSSDLKNKLIPDFDNYGICVEQFFVRTVLRPEDDPNYQRFKSLYFRQFADIAEAELRQKVGVIEQSTEAQKTVIQAQSVAQKRNIEAYSYQQERGFDVAEKVAANEGTGNFSSAGIGLGMIAGVGGAVGSTVGGAFSTAMNPIKETSVAPQESFCQTCGAKVNSTMSFCSECGTALTPLKKPSCIKCGFVFDKEGKFCPKCGTKREV